ncbi:MAG: GtrA family protein [Prevotella sp.]|nr:GtrA family protein [Prevotella sp.]
MKPITNPSDTDKWQKLGEVVRFGIVGALATAIQYGIYLLCLRWTNAGVANTIGYAISFVFNFFASTFFTFRVRANARRGAGFVLSHVINYLLQMSTLAFFIWAGVPKQWAPVPMFAICVPVNFLLVRYFMKRK